METIEFNEVIKQNIEVVGVLIRRVFFSYYGRSRYTHSSSQLMYWSVL